MSSGQNSSASSNKAAPSSESHDASLVRSAQQALKDKGYDAGAIDGQMGPATEGALRSFQQAQGLPQTGDLDQRTLAALGVQGRGASSGSSASANPSATSSTGSSAMSQDTASSPQASGAAQ
jgi:peptidoglycan hydrolase-like protein with peptidoglycan-binding domain